MTPLGDRRSHLRLEVVGTLWGGLKFDDLARVVNKSDSGVLIASLTAPAVDSIQSVQLEVDGQVRRVDGRVRHFRRMTALNGTSEYLVGLELLPPSDS